VDYFLRPKPAYFTIARELRPYTVGMTRKEVKAPSSDVSAAFFEITTVLEVWGTNSTLEEKKATLDVRVFELSTGWTDGWSKEVVLAPNASTELYKGDLPGQAVRTKLSERPRTLVVSARLLDAEGTVLGRYSNW
jgi:beta-mannosidase